VKCPHLFILTKKKQMNVGDLIRFAVLNLPCGKRATKRGFCISGHLSAILSSILRAGTERDVVGSSDVLSHLCDVVMMFPKDSCVYDDVVYQITVSCIWFCCGTEALAMKAMHAVGTQRLIRCLSSVICKSSFKTRVSGWATSFSDALRVLNYCLLSLDPSDIPNFATIMYEERILLISFGGLFHESKDDRLLYLQEEGIGCLTALLIQLLEYACKHGPSSVDDALDSVIGHKMTSLLVGRWMWRPDLLSQRAGTAAACLLLLSLSLDLGPVVHSSKLVAMSLRVSTIMEVYSESRLVCRYANLFRAVVKNYRVESNDDDCCINFVQELPCRSEMLQHFLGEEIDETKSCLWCGREKIPLLMCSVCREAKYCSSACQNLHWDRHKIDCALK
jgi:hypothetical protein